jgi:hypothetical protein
MGDYWVDAKRMTELLASTEDSASKLIKIEETRESIPDALVDFATDRHRVRSVREVVTNETGCDRCNGQGHVADPRDNRGPVGEVP